MSFKLHPDAKNWFKSVQSKPPLVTFFDTYHLCFTIGAAYGRKKDLENGELFADEFILRYRPHQAVMIGVLLTSSMNRQGIDFANKDSVVKEAERLIASSSNGTQLTAAGYKEMNAYAAGGFDLLSEELNEPPSNIVYLLDRFSNLLGKASTKI